MNRTKEVVDRILAGEVRTAARLMRELDDGRPEAREILKEIYRHSGRAHIIGITGSPGVGKSTLTDRLIQYLRQEGKTVGVVAVDPTSPFSGGAILGDRIRMQRHALDEGVFIRSLATRGHFGGLTASARAVITVLDAMGKDYVLVETVGVGQDEVEIAATAYTTLVVTVPGMGDDIQAIKAGILEVADILVINKADREGASRTYQELLQMLELQAHRKATAWKAPVLMTQAKDNEGIEELMAAVQRSPGVPGPGWGQGPAPGPRLPGPPGVSGTPAGRGFPAPGEATGGRWPPGPGPRRYPGEADRPVLGQRGPGP